MEMSSSHPGKKNEADEIQDFSIITVVHSNMAVYMFLITVVDVSFLSLFISFIYFLSFYFFGLNMIEKKKLQVKSKFS